MPDENQNPQEGQQNQNTPAFDATAIAETVRTVMQEHSQSQQNQQQTELTPEQRDEFMKVWKPDKAFVDEFRGAFAEEADDNTRVQPFIKLRGSLMEQAQRYSELYVQHQLQQFEAKFAPVMKFYTEQQAKQQTDAFYGTYPQLKEHEDIVKAVAASMHASGTTAKTPKEAHEILAKGVEAVIKRLRPDFALSTQESQKTQQNPGGMPAMAALSSGGNGAGSKPAGNDANNEFSIWKR